MGGGDLNSKKSWHPNTMKNQERVWKAEQAAAEEKKRILELQRERGEERNREELNSMAKQTAGNITDDRLHWMYNKPDKKIQEEDYLLGKAIDSNYEKAEKADQDIIPAVARRVVGSSMLTTAGDTQVDLVRKLREDPLLLVKERERAARAALLNNPLQRRKLTELLKKEQEKRNKMKVKKKSKNKDKNLDQLLATKLSALGGEQNLDIATLLASDISSSNPSSDSEETKIKKPKKRKKKSKKSKKNKSNSDAISSDDDRKNVRSEKFPSNSSETNKVQQHKSTEKLKISDRDHKKVKKYESSEECEERLNNTSKKLTYKTKHDPKVSKRIGHRERINEGGMNKSKTDKTFRDSKLHRERSISTDLSSPNSSTTKYKTLEIIKKSEKERNYLGNVTQKIARRKSNSTERYRQAREKDRFHNIDRKKRRSSPFEDRPSNQITKRRRSKSEDRRESQTKKRAGLTEEEKAAKLAEMAAAGAEHERDRGKRVAEQRAETEQATKPSYRRSNNEARSLPDSLQSRIHSNRHYIQRNERHMNEHFARR